MNKFPDFINEKNRAKFADILEERILQKLREEILDVVLQDDCSNFYDISSFKYGSYKNIKDLIKQVMKELEELGWKTKLSYGDTALFIYTGLVPVNCW
jgi:hypothetical protein